MNLALTIRAVNVPDSLPHKNRATEIKELPQYLSVVASSIGTAAFINVGASEPEQSNRVYPWARTDYQGRPMGLYVYYGGAWVKMYEKAVGQIEVFSGLVSNIPQAWVFCDGTNGTIDLRLAMWYVNGGMLTPGTAATQSSYAVGYMMYVGYP